MCISNSSNVNFKSSFYSAFFSTLPNTEIKNPAKFNRLGHILASPHWNRLAIGCAAITTQPAIDYFNPRVDKDTAKASAYRTLGKILACTGVGFVVRGAMYKLTEKFAHISNMEGSTLLTPKVILQEKNVELQKNMLKLLKNTFSTVSAIIIMSCCTNFLFDAPLTTYLANKFISTDKSLNKKHMEAA